MSRKAEALLFSLGYTDADYAAIRANTYDMRINIGMFTQDKKYSDNRLTYSAKERMMDTERAGGNRQ